MDKAKIKVGIQKYTMIIVKYSIWKLYKLNDIIQVRDKQTNK